MSILVATEGPAARITLDQPDALNALTAEGCWTSLPMPSSGWVGSRNLGHRAAGRGPGVQRRRRPEGARRSTRSRTAPSATCSTSRAPCDRGHGAARAIVVAAVHGFCFTGALELRRSAATCASRDRHEVRRTRTRSSDCGRRGDGRAPPRAVGLPRRAGSRTPRGRSPVPRRRPGASPRMPFPPSSSTTRSTASSPRSPTAATRSLRGSGSTRRRRSSRCPPGCGSRPRPASRSPTPRRGSRPSADRGAGCRSARWRCGGAGGGRSHGASRISSAPSKIDNTRASTK